MTRILWKFEPAQRWIRTILNGEEIADSKRAMLMIESPAELDYYFPVQDLRKDFLEVSGYSETSNYRGIRRFWHVVVDGVCVENAAWSYDPWDNRPDLHNYIAFQWDKMDRWFEEDEEVFGHPRNPYHRFDIIESSRHVEVRVDGVTIVETDRPYFLLETGLPVRYYIPEEDMDFGVLQPSDSATYCPYKGFASYYNLAVGSEPLEDAVWYYPDPIAEAPRLKGLYAFWPEKDKKRIKILVDGEPAD